jgi:transcriptional regulator with XRE-family HTH domain
MTALAITPALRGASASLAREIGQTFREIRERRGDLRIDVARAAGVPHQSVTRFERGDSANLQLGNATRLLAFYGYKLAVVPVQDKRSAFSADVDLNHARAFQNSHYHGSQHRSEP